MRRGVRIAAIATTSILIALPAAAQFFSPGPLARPHAQLEGLEKCSSCHEQQKGLSAKLCLDCHVELARRVSKGAGFHGRMAAEKRAACQDCHPDHRGKDFSMVEWEGGRDAFDHRQTGWLLKGGHAKVKCDDCHQRAFITDAPVRKLLDRFPKQPTYLGVSERCATCHFDEHRGQLGNECQKCHDEVAWKKAPAFNHQTSAFALKGKHKEVACAKCHTTVNDEHMPARTVVPVPRASTFMQMKPVDFKTCESCHDDPHKGSLGPACASCHSEAGWKIMSMASGRDTAFHDKTRFPLRGGHVGVACRSCHGPFPGQPARFKGLAFTNCSDCHADAHIGQLTAKPPAKVAACDRCHTVNAFTPVRFEWEDHAATAFPLDGAHRAAACRGCHPVDNKLAQQIPLAVKRTLVAQRRPQTFSMVVLHPKQTPTACLGCHQDVHRGQFAKQDQRDTCNTCHRTTSFTDLAFDHDKDSRFPLTGKHAETACAACHKGVRVGSGTATMVRYKPLETACRSCHADIHQGQFLLANRAAEPSDETSGDRSSAGPDCSVCHRTDKFTPTLFDHNNPKFTSYALDGKHAKLECQRCHPSVTVASVIKTVRYRPLPRTCEGCHVDFHHGAFRGFEP